MEYTPTAGIKTGGKDFAERVGLTCLKSVTEPLLNMRLIKHQVNASC